MLLPSPPPPSAAHGLVSYSQPGLSDSTNWWAATSVTMIPTSGIITQTPTLSLNSIGQHHSESALTADAPPPLLLLSLRRHRPPPEARHTLNLSDLVKNPLWPIRFWRGVFIGHDSDALGVRLSGVHQAAALITADSHADCQLRKPREYREPRAAAAAPRAGRPAPVGH